MDNGSLTIKEALNEIRRLDEKPYLIGITVDKMESILVSKGADYSRGTHVWTAPERAALLITDDLDLAPLALFYQIGIKLARIISLTWFKGLPNNESLNDSWLDLANYIVLIYTYIKWKQERQDD